jgi:hypothetical protein
MVQTLKKWAKIEDPDINSCTYSHQIFDKRAKGAQNKHWRKDSVFNKWCGENWISTCRRLKINSCL